MVGTLSFQDPTEHLMPINWKHSWKQVNFYCTTQKVIFWTDFASAKKMISQLPTQHFCRIRKTIFEKNLTLALPSWKASIFPEMTFFQGSVSWKIDSLHIKTHFSIWCNCLGERKNYLLRNNSSSHQPKKDNFLKLLYRF